MNSLKKRWITALRSGEYKQCREVLRDDNKFCAIGVLCDIEAKSSWFKIGINNWENEKYNNDRIDLPSTTASYVGSMNDTGYSFNYIADYLEKHVDDNLEIIS